MCQQTFCASQASLSLRRSISVFAFSNAFCNLGGKVPQWGLSCKVVTVSTTCHGVVDEVDALSNINRWRPFCFRGGTGDNSTLGCFRFLSETGVAGFGGSGAVMSSCSFAPTLASPALSVFWSSGSLLVAAVGATAAPGGCSAVFSPFLARRRGLQTSHPLAVLCTWETIKNPFTDASTCPRAHRPRKMNAYGAKLKQPFRSCRVQTGAEGAESESSSELLPDSLTLPSASAGVSIAFVCGCVAGAEGRLPVVITSALEIVRSVSLQGKPERP